MQEKISETELRAFVFEIFPFLEISRQKLLYCRAQNGIGIVVKIHTRFCIPTKQPVASNQRNSFYICFLFTVPLLFLPFAVKCSTISFLAFPSVTRRIYFRLRVICPVKFPAFCLVNATTTNTKPNETRYHC